MKHYLKFTLFFILIFAPAFGYTDEPVTSGAQALVNSSNQFAFDLYKQFSQTKSNFLVSPYGLSAVLSSLKLGANGVTKYEIATVTHLPAQELGSANLEKTWRQGKMPISTSFWFDKKINPTKDFVENLFSFYGAVAERVNFSEHKSAIAKINRWISLKTNGNISSSFEETPLNSALQFVLINVINFQGKWTEAFLKENTSLKDFWLNETDKKPVLMMSQETKYYHYAETDQLQILEMEYENYPYSMLIFLPKEKNLASLTNRLTLEKFEELKSSLKRVPVIVQLPKIKLRQDINLKKVLTDMGMTTAFTSKANFLKIDSQQPLFVDTIGQQSLLEIDEEGTKIVMVHRVSGRKSGSSNLGTVKNFIVDHPFVFIIQDKRDGTILFMSQIVDPTQT